MVQLRGERWRRLRRDRAGRPARERPAPPVEAEIVPPALRAVELGAARKQRAATRLEAVYLMVLLAAPAAQLLSAPPPGRAGFRDAVSAVLLLAAVGMRLLLRRLAVDADWVRDRRDSETARAAAWRRCATGRADAGDGPLSRQLRTAGVEQRWQFYREHRMDDQIDYFADRADRHRRTARRWRLIRLVLTVGTLGVAAAALLLPVPGAAIGLVSALLATSEAWLQFRRSEVLAASFAEARDELRGLRAEQPAGEEALARAVDAVETALERERWTWTAIMSVTVLTSSPRSSSAPAGGEPPSVPGDLPRTVRLGDRDVPLVRFTGPAPDVRTVAAALAEAGLEIGRRPVVVLVGGADGLTVDDPAAWTALFRDGLVPGLVRAGACLVDGGTDAGVLAFAGQARAAAAADYPAVGVAAAGTVRWPGRAPLLADAAEIGPQHTHLVSVPGQRWGTEPPWISLVATALAGGAPTLTVVINGGPITLDDVRRSLAAGRRVLVVAGTGRLADTLAAARRHPDPPGAVGPAEWALAASPLLDVVDGLADPALLADAIAALADQAG
jgi:SLOG in TRPM, prokaryote/SMODS and SLOG-associating 2TM effector domain 1